MCELFGLSSNKIVNISFTWRGFRRRGERNPDGWGIAWYIDDQLVGLVKEPMPAPESPISRLMVRGVSSKIIVSHVRLASQGDLSYVNTHPFARSLWGRDWVFAHNGHVSGFIEDSGYELDWCRPAGDTDSEHAFCFILENLGSLADRSLGSIVTRLWRLASEIGEYGKFNFLLSNGAYLFAYMNRAGTLHYLLRHPPHRRVARLEDEDYTVNLAGLKAHDEYASIIATKPLTDEEWIEMDVDTLYVFHGGDLLLTMDYHGPRLALDKLEYEVLKAIRSSPRSVRLGEVSERLRLPIDEVARAVERLRVRGIIRQHSMDYTPPSHPDSRYYTNPELRGIIDTTIGRA